MTPRHWMQVAALASVLGLTGTAIANDTDRTTRSDDRSGGSTYGMDTPSSGAIVTPEDKAAGMGADNEHARNRNGDGDDDAATSNENTSNDEQLSVNPGPSTDEQLSINPRPGTDDASPTASPAR